jgi:hypothetical protein
MRHLAAEVLPERGPSQLDAALVAVVVLRKGSPQALVSGPDSVASATSGVLWLPNRLAGTKI